MGLEIISRLPESNLVKGEDIIAVIFNNGKLLTAINTSGGKGIIKVWTADLQLIFELQAHEYPMFDMTKGNGSQFFTSSSDCTIHHWEDENGRFVLIDILRGGDEPAWKLRFSENILYSGYSTGQVRMWENGEMVACLGTVEEIWDMLIEKGVLYTTRHLDVYLTTIRASKREDGDRMSNWSIKNTIEGTGPLLIYKEMLCCLCRSGGAVYNILIHGLETGNPLQGTLSGHEAIVTALVHNKKFLFSGGYDRKIISWDLESKTKLSEIQLDQYITSMTVDPATGIVFVGGENRYICSIRMS